jgi:hypothetical protein
VADGGGSSPGEAPGEAPAAGVTRDGGLCGPEAARYGGGPGACGGGGGGITDALLAAREACPALDAMIRAAGLARAAAPTDDRTHLLGCDHHGDREGAR